MKKSLFGYSLGLLLGLSSFASAATVTLILTGDAYNGPPIVDISVDGKAVGSAPITATVKAGSTQRVDVPVTPGSHTVTVAFGNDAWGGSAATDRNLYLKGAFLDGATIPAVAADFFSNSNYTFSVVVPDPAAPPPAAPGPVASLPPPASVPPAVVPPAAVPPVSDGQVGAKLDVLHTDLQSILAQLKAAPVAAPAPVGQPVPPPAPVMAGLNDPCVGRTDKWATLSLTPADSIKASLNCAKPGFVITLAAGRYKEAYNIPASLGGPGIVNEIAGAGADKTILDGQGGCTLGSNSSGGGCATRLAYGNGVVRTEASLLLHDLEVTGGGTNAGDAHDGQAGLYIAGGGINVTARHVMFRRNQMGAFANAAFAKGSTFLAEECDFVENSTDGGSHDTYLSALDSFTSRRNHYYGSRYGNNSKSRQVAKLTYEDDYNESNEGRWIDAAEGASITVVRGVYVGGTVSQNVFGNGEEGTFAVGTASFDGSRIHLRRGSDFMATGVTTFNNVTVTQENNAGAFNDRGPAMVGFPDPIPAGTAPDRPPFISGAK